MRILLLLLALLLGLQVSSPPAYAQSGEMTPEERYEAGLRAMQRGYHTRALEHFNRLRNFHRDDPVSVLAELAIADVYFRRGDFEQARLAYEDFARLHPRHASMDYVIYRIGLCHYRRASSFAGRDQTATRHAVNVWTGFAERFPDSQHRDEVVELTSTARSRLAAKELFVARFYAQREAWFAARRRAEDLLRRYPDTEFVPEALALAAEGYHRWGLVREAAAMRDRLASEHPDSRWLARADRVLAQPAGAPPVEETFMRPYRVRGVPTFMGGMGGMGGQQ